MPSRTSRPRAPIQVPAGVVTARGTREDRTMADETIHWFAGVDWGSAKHQVCLLDGAGKVVGEREFAHGGAGLAALCDWLVSAWGEPGVGGGGHRGAAWTGGGCSSGPRLRRIRDQSQAARPAARPHQRRRGQGRPARCPSRSRRVAHGSASVPPRAGRRPKRDRAPRVVAAGRGTPAGAGAPLEPHPPAALALLPAASRIERLTAEWVLALWTLAPTPAQAARLREATLARRLRQPRIRKLDAPAVLDILRQPAITVAPGVTEAAVLHLRSRVARLRLANQEFHQAARKLEELCTALSETDSAAQDSGPGDAAILRSLPGVGPVTLATLLTEAAGPLARRDDAALRTLSGVAPVTKRSGKTWVVVMRYAAQVRLRQAVFPWARIAVQIDRTCRGRYEALRARGHS